MVKKLLIALLLCLPTISSSQMLILHKRQASIAIPETNNLKDSLVAYWEFEEGDNTDRIDSVANHHYIEGQFTDSYQNTSEYVLGSASVRLAVDSYFGNTFEGRLRDSVQDSWTVMTWLRLDSIPQTGNPSYILEWAAGKNMGYVRINNGGDSTFYWKHYDSTGTNREAYYSVKPEVDTWYQMFYWYDIDNPDSLFLEVKGLADVEAIYLAGGGIQYDDAALRMRYVRGCLDAMAFWKRPLTVAERTLLYNFGSGKPYPEWEGTPYQNNSLQDSLVAYWAMEEVSNATRNNLVADTIHAYDYSGDVALSTVANVGFGSVVFDGTVDSYLKLDAPAIADNGIDLTFATWLYFDALTVNDDIVLGGTGELFLRARVRASGDQYFQFYATESTGGAWKATGAHDSSSATGRWFFYVGWFDGSNIYLQINNGSVVSAAFAGIDDVIPDFVFGWEDAGDRIIGKMDDTMLWYRVLTVEERTWLYNSGNGRTYTDLIEVPSKQVMIFS